MEQHVQSPEQTQNTQKASKKIWLVLGGIILLIIIFSASSGDKNSQPVSESPVVTENKVTYDIPSLFGKDIDQIRAELGNPAIDTEPTKEQLTLGTKEWEKSYKKDNKELLITYYTHDRKVKDFFLSGDDKQHLLQVGGLKENDQAYTLEFVKVLKDPSQITGVI